MMQGEPQKMSSVFGVDQMGSPSNKMEIEKHAVNSQVIGLNKSRHVPNHSRIFAANGQISPVSGRSLAFTENDQKFSLGSYVPSHLSSYKGVGGHNPYEIGKVRVSLLNFCNNALQRQ